MKNKKCPRCQCENFVKNGKADGKQRYLCKNCSFNFTRFTKRGKSKKIKVKAMEMYLEGLGFRAIGRILQVSNVAVLKWTRKTTENLRKILKENISGNSIVEVKAVRGKVKFDARNTVDEPPFYMSKEASMEVPVGV